MGRSGSPSSKSTTTSQPTRGIATEPLEWSCATRIQHESVSPDMLDLAHHPLPFEGLARGIGDRERVARREREDVARPADARRRRLERVHPDLRAALSLGGIHVATGVVVVLPVEWRGAARLRLQVERGPLEVVIPQRHAGGARARHGGELEDRPPDTRPLAALQGTCALGPVSA